MVRLIFRHRCASMAVELCLAVNSSMALQDVRQHLPGHRSILGPTQYFESDSPGTFRGDIDDAHHYLSSSCPIASGMCGIPDRVGAHDVM